MATANTLPARQNNKLQSIKKTAKPQAANFNSEIEHAWQLYREQLQRNFELMQIITEMQKTIGQSTIINLQPAPVVQNQQVEEKTDEREQLPELKSIPMKQFKKLLQIYELTVVPTKRSDAVQSHLELMYALFQLQEAYPEKLYMQMGIPDSSGYRYVRMLQQANLVKHSRGKLMLTKSGQAMMTAELNTPQDALQLITILKSQGTIYDYQNTFAVENWFAANGTQV